MAIGATVSQLVSLVATGIPDGSRVLVAKNEFTSVTFPFAAQQHRGIKLIEVDLDDLPSRVDSADVVAVSVVQSADGSQVDFDALRENSGAAGVP
ncbi:MAG: aminotransferase, partial [Actinophytocola sp.]|nr:aminotransferase [Actinophytocola sp.]